MKSRQEKKSNDRNRGVDILIKGVNNSLVFYTFAKYCGPNGSATDTHQVNEAISFIKEAKRFIDNNPSFDGSQYFVVLVDGKAGESHIEEMTMKVSDYSNVFIGNSEGVIDFVNKKMMGI